MNIWASEGVAPGGEAGSLRFAPDDGAGLP